MTELEVKFTTFVSNMSNTMKSSNHSRSFKCPICNTSIHSLYIRHTINGVTGSCSVCGYNYNKILEKYKDSK